MAILDVKGAFGGLVGGVVMDGGGDAAACAGVGGGWGWW